MIENDLYPYILTLSKTVLIIVFIISSGGKLLDTNSFIVTLRKFNIFSDKLVRPIAVLFIISEIATVLLLLFSKTFLFAGFLASSVLLFIFTVALIHTLKGNIQISCNCFGKSSELITKFDVYRNIIFIICSAFGIILSNYQAIAFNGIEWVFIILWSIALLYGVMHLKEILPLIQSRKTSN